MVGFLDRNTDVGVVGPMLLNADGRSIQLEGARRLPRPFDTFSEYVRVAAFLPRSAWTRRHLMPEWDHRDSADVQCLSGACLMMRRELFAEVGELDEGYPFNVEDVDWCHRVGQTRWRIRYLADAKIVHFGRQSIIKNRGVAALGAMQGVYRYYGKFYGNGMALCVWLLLWPPSVVKMFIWLGVWIVRPSQRRLARSQAATFLAICRLSPWFVRREAA